MSKDTLLSNNSIANDLVTDDPAMVLSAAQGAIVGSAINTDKRIMDAYIPNVPGFFIGARASGTAQVNFKWMGTNQQVVCEYLNTGVDLGATLTFSYYSSKAGVWVTDSHNEDIFDSVSTVYFNPADTTVFNPDLTMGATGDISKVRGSIALLDGTFSLQFELEAIRVIDYLPTSTPMISLSAWRLTTTG